MEAALCQVNEIGPFLSRVPDHQSYPDGDVRGGQMYESKPRCQTESLHENLQMKYTRLVNPNFHSQITLQLEIQKARNIWVNYRQLLLCLANRLAIFINYIFKYAEEKKTVCLIFRNSQSEITANNLVQSYSIFLINELSTIELLN